MPLAIAKRGGIRSNNTTVTRKDGKTVCTLHQTTIATLDEAENKVYLNTGGYNTPTTFRRMNACLNAWGFTKRVCKADFKASNTFCVTE